MLRPALATVLLGLVACAEPPSSDEVAEDPNAGLLRDFIDGKFDAAGHPLNAKVVEARQTCTGPVRNGIVELRGACSIAIPEGAAVGGLTVNARIRVRTAPAVGTIATLRALADDGTEVGVETLTVERLRYRNRWIDFPITVETTRAIANVSLEITPGAIVDFDYVEVFPKKLGVVINPGSGVYRDTDKLTFELPKGKKIERLQADGVDILPQLEHLLDTRTASRTTTAFRTLIEVRVGDLLPTRAEVSELRVHSSGDTSRTQIRTQPPACDFVGDPTGTKVLVTGFQPFPADGWHDNISGVAVTALRPDVLRDAQVMKLVLPVEYDRAAATIADVVERCAPAAVLSFGQGGSAIALEEVSYNLQDTGELAGGAPDNRGILRAAHKIDLDAPETRETLLPLDDIEAALIDLGEDPRRSTDPGRYICNNVMFSTIGKIALRGRSGFIHLPYTTSFADAAKARWGAVAEAAVQAPVDAM